MKSFFFSLFGLGLWLTGAVGVSLAIAWNQIMAVPTPLLPRLAPWLLVMVAGGVLLSRQRRLAVTAVGLGIVFASVAFLMPNFLMTRGRGKLIACRSNLKNLATALEMYAADNDGRYPPSLARLVGENYLKAIPTCGGEEEDDPGMDSYTAGYQSPDGKGFQLCCKGMRHPVLVGRPDSPRIDSVRPGPRG